MPLSERRVRQSSQLVRMKLIGSLPERSGDLVFAIDVISHDHRAGFEGFGSFGGGEEGARPAVACSIDTNGSRQRDLHERTVARAQSGIVAPL
jgi:hypothetical protein